MNPSLQSNPSIQCNPSLSCGALPSTNCTPGTSRLNVQSTSSPNRFVVRPDGIPGSAVSDKSHNGMVRTPQSSKDTSNNFDSINDVSSAELPKSSKQESYTKVNIAINRHLSMSDFERCQGDISKADMDKAHLPQGFACSESFDGSCKTENCVEINECNLERLNTDSEVTKATSNPFEDDDQVDGFADGSSNQVIGPGQTNIAAPHMEGPVESYMPLPEKDPNNQSTRSSSYASAEDSCAAEPVKAPPKLASSQGMPSASRVSQYSSLVSGVYLPCSIPYPGTSADMVGLSGVYPISFPHVSYGVFPRSQKPEKSVLKKLSSFLSLRKK